MDLQRIKKNLLKDFWGYDEFRDLQEAIIDSVLSGKDTLALLPTGGGKSMCYQLPALMLEGTCIVISPLIALMRDQVFQLKNLGIEAEYLSSELDDAEAENIYINCKNGITKLLYVSPERLQNPHFLQNIEEIQVSFLAVDEAHCISEWGQDFRPSYQNINTFRKEFKNVPILALTATATPLVLDEIKKKLELRKAVVFNKSFRRGNLRIIHQQIADKYQQVLNFVRHNPASGIIYTRTRQEAEQMTEFLLKNNINNVDFFHAGLPASQKLARQKKWVQSNSHVLVSTNAFGMGIDKDNVRFVIHFSPPASLENYYQEIGRAGRDRLESNTLLLWNEQELNDFDKILINQIPDKKTFTDAVAFLYSIFQIADLDSSDQTFEISISRIQNFIKKPAASIKNILNFLHNQEIIFYNDSKSLSVLELKIKPSELDILPKKDAWFIENLLRTLPGIHLQKIHFSELSLAQKLGADRLVVQERLREAAKKNYLEYINGANATVKFLKPRNDRAIRNEYWKLFEQIQKNKLQKWEEMKFFVQNQDLCKMKMILTYFGEKNAKSCGKCSACLKQKQSIFGNSEKEDIKKILLQNPASLDEIAVKLAHYPKEKLLKNLILLLDSGEVKMRDFRTYQLA